MARILRERGVSMKITIISHLFPNSQWIFKGIFVKEQVKALLEKNIEIEQVIAPTPYIPHFLSFFKENWKKYYKIERQEWLARMKVMRPRYIVIPGKHFFWLQGIFMGIRLAYIFRQHKINYDVLHAHCILPDGLAAIIVNRLSRGGKIVCTIHGDDLNTYPWYDGITTYMAKVVIKNTDLFICVSEALKTKLIALEGSANAVTIRNGIDTARFKAHNRVHHSYTCQREFVFLFVGDVTRMKGAEDLLMAFAEFNNVYRNSKLWIVGDINNADFPLRDIVAHNVKFIGVIPNEEIPDIMNAADVFVLPSYSEGLPTVMLEAMACQLPIIITEVGGIPEVLSNRKSAILINPGNVDELKKAMICVLEKSLRETISLEAQQILLENHTWNVNTTTLIKAYSELI